MNTKGMKFLAVLAVLAMAFAAFAVVAPAETDDAADAPVATGLYTYSAESGYTAVNFGSAVTISTDTTWYAYSTDVSTPIVPNNGFTVSAGVTLTITSYGDSQYEVKIEKTKAITISATASKVVLDGVDLIIEDGGTWGTHGIVGGASASASAVGTLELKNGSKVFYGQESNSPFRMLTTANTVAHAGTTVVMGNTETYGTLGKVLIGEYGKEAVITPSAASGYSETDTIEIKQVYDTALHMEYTVNMDVSVKDNNISTDMLFSAGDKATISEGVTVTAVALDGAAQAGIPYGSTITNNGNIVVPNGGTLVFASQNNANDVSTVGILGEGTITVKSGGLFVIPEGSAKESNNTSATATESLFATGHNTIVVEKGGKLIAANNDETTHYWGIVGGTAATDAADGAQAYTTFASVNKFIWVPTGDNAKVTIKAKYIDPSGTVNYTITEGAIYKADGAITLGAPNTNKYDWAARYDEIIINSGVTTLTKGFEMAAGYSGPTLTIAKGAELKQTATSPGGYTFTTVAGAIINVKGTLTINSMTGAYPDSVSFVVYDGGALYVNSASTEKLLSIAYQGGKIYHGTTDRTSLYSEQTAVPVTTENALEEAIEAGAKDISVGASFDLTDNLEIPSGTTLTVGTACALTVPSGKVLTVTNATIDGKITLDNQTIIADDVKGSFTMKSGSVYINGVLTTGSFTVQKDTQVHVTGSLNGEFHFLAANDIAAENPATVQFDDFTVNSTGKLYLQPHTGLTYKVGGTTDDKVKYFYLYGTIVPEGNAPVGIAVNKAVNKSNTFMAFAGAQLSGKVTVSGNGNIDLSQAQNTQKIDQDISADKEYGQLESVEVIGTLDIKNNSSVCIRGSLTIAENVTLTIESGSTLIVSGDIAKVIIDGKIVVEDGATFQVENAKTVDIAGTLESSGTVTISDTDTSTTVKKGGLILIRDDDRSTITVSGALTVSAGATVDIRGGMTLSGTVSNKGSVIFNSATLKADSTIAMAADSATLEIKSVTADDGDAALNENFSLTITDYDLKFTSTKKVGNADKNVVTIGFVEGETFKGLVVTEAVTSYEQSGSTIYTNHMALSGTAAFTDEDGVPVNNKTVIVNGKNMEVNGDLVLGAGITLSNAQVLKVKGTIVGITAYTNVPAGKVAGQTGSMITVAGKITQLSAIADAATYVSAAYYTEDIAGITFHVYTSLAAAVEDGAKSIKTTGNVSVSADLEVPATVTITNDASGVITVGKDAKVFVKDGAVVKNGTVDVYGTLTFENKKNCKSTVLSDVTVENGDSITYTSVASAIATSSEGDVITITRNGETKITSSMTIPEGRTLNVPASKTLVIAPGVTLTVNGMLQTAEKILVDKTSKAEWGNAEFGTKASLTTDPETAAITVNGVFRTMAEQTYAYYKTAGAYYDYADSDGNYKYISPIAIAVDSPAKDIKVNGEVNAGSISWAGTSTLKKTFTIETTADLTVQELNFSYVNFDNKGTFTGTLAYGDNAVIANEIDALTAVNDKDGETVIMLVTATVGSDEDAKLTISKGTVYARTITGDLTVASGATLAALPAGTDNNLVITGDLFLDGTLSVNNGRYAVVQGDAEIFGFVVVAQESDDGTKAKGTLIMNDVYLGITEKAVIGTSAAASIAGPVEFDILYAAAGTTVPSEVTEDTAMKSTVFIVDDAEYITAYTKATTYYIDDVDFYLETADFGGWYNVDKKSADEYNAKIGASDWSVVYADLDYDVYTLFVKTDNGVKSVAVDGKELINVGNNIFVSYTEPLGFEMSAGKYVLTFTLKDGYEGTPVLYDADGKAVLGGYGITIAGDEDHRIVTYQLSGTEQIIAPEPTPVEQNEWTITTILLVILVILIAVMAVIVALRLNRS